MGFSFLIKSNLYVRNFEFMKHKKTSFLILFLSLSLFFFNLCSILAKEAGFKNKVIVKVVGLSPVKGVLRLALYKGEKTYSERKDPVRAARLPVRSANVTVTFKDLEPGFYAIMFYHDANNNNEFDTFFGLPLEQYGFSQNARPRFSAPSFERVKFKVPKEGEITMKLIAQ